MDPDRILSTSSSRLLGIIWDSSHLLLVWHERKEKEKKGREKKGKEEDRNEVWLVNLPMEGGGFSCSDGHEMPSSRDKNALAWSLVIFYPQTLCMYTQGPKYL